jgi:CopG family nickel-responsive transcriptional regulator
MNDRTIRFTVSLPEALMNDLDANVTGKGYSSRSEFIRDLIREKMSDAQWQKEGGLVAGVLTIIYDHHQRGLSEKLIALQHSDAAHILCNTHVHVDHHNCLETIIIKGEAEAINDIAIKIGGIKGVKFAKLTKTSFFKTH